MRAEQLGAAGQWREAEAPRGRSHRKQSRHPELLEVPEQWCELKNGIELCFATCSFALRMLSLRFGSKQKRRPWKETLLSEQRRAPLYKALQYA